LSFLEKVVSSSSFADPQGRKNPNIKARNTKQIQKREMKPGIKRGKQELSPRFPCLDFGFVSDFGIRILNFPFKDLFERGLF